MRKQITVVFLLCVLLMTGCDDANSTEVQQMLSGEQTEEIVSEEINLEETNVMEGESVSEEITTEQEDAGEEESVTSSESIEEASKNYIIERKVIPVEEIVYEENDVVFVIAKRFSLERGDSDYGYLISAGGKVVPFEVSFEDYCSDEIFGDYGKVLDMETAEPIMELEDDVINYYIDKFKNIDDSKEMSRQFHGYDYMYEYIMIDGRRIDCDKNVYYVDIYSLTDGILKPTDPNAIELMEWLLDLNETLTKMTEEK